MAELTLAQAAKLAGVGRATIYRAVRDGVLSATVRHDGTRVVDTAELMRVYGPLKAAPDAETVSRPARETAPLRQPETAGETGRDTAAPPAPIPFMTAEDRRREVEIAGREALRAELAAARETIRRLEAQAAESREREAKLMDLAQSATRLLEHREIAATPPRKGFLRRLFGG